MECTHCRHSITVVESFTIVNPWSFPCPGCTKRLRVGPRGNLFVAVAGLLGAVIGSYFSVQWVRGHMSMATGLLWIAGSFAAAMLPIQWAAVRFGDTRPVD